jgi:hypothetical protein
MRALKGPLDLSLIALTILSVTAIFVGHEDDFARSVLCGKLPCPELGNAHAWQKIIYDLGIGSLISLIFYGLVVRLPERQKRLRIKRSFAKHYCDFKEDCIATMLMAADGTFEWGFHKTLIDQVKFREYFKEQVSSSQDRWDALANNLNEYHLQSLITSMEILRREIEFVLESVDIPDEKPFEHLKRLSNLIITLKNTTLDYDSSKSLCHFLWDVFAGFSFTTGYRGRDVIADMIKEI